MGNGSETGSAAGNDQSQLEGSVLMALGTLRWATTTEGGRRASPGLRFTRTEPNSATIEIDRNLGLGPMASILPISGLVSQGSVAGLWLRESARGGVELLRDNLEAVIRISDLTVEDLQEHVLTRHGRSHADRFQMLLHPRQEGKPKSGRAPDRRMNALISLVARRLGAVMPMVGGHSSIWKSIGPDARISVEIELATHHLTAEEIVQRICADSRDTSLTLVSRSRLQPPAHYPLSVGHDVIDLRVVPAGAWHRREPSSASPR